MSFVRNAHPSSDASGSIPIGQNKPAVKTRTVQRRKSCNDQSKPTEKSRSPPKSTPAKSNMKSAHRCSNRSKSVSFDQNVHSSDAQGSISIGSNGALAGNAPIDLSVGSQIGNGMKRTQNRSQSVGGPSLVAQQSDGRAISNSSQTSGIQNQTLSSQAKLMYENRIEGLVDSNRSKIVRIKELAAERNILLGEIDTLHRINRSLAATVDAYNEASTEPENGREEVAQMQAEIKKLQDEVNKLRARVQRLNKENFELRTNNGKLKAYLDTHSKQVLNEHNYNMNI